MAPPAICIGKLGPFDHKCPPNSPPLPPMLGGSGVCGSGGSVGGHFPFGGGVGGHYS